MKLWLVRHAQPLIAPGICYGQLDMDADPEATRNCAVALAKVLPKGIYANISPLQRCEQLWPILIGLRPDLSYKSDARLKEMNFGNWEGKPWSDIPKAALDAWTADFSSHPAGGTGESVSQFMARVASAFDELPASKDALWITHAGVIRAAQLLSGGTRRIERADQWPTAAPAYGQWCTLDVKPIRGIPQRAQ